jgi:hypothetical protein
MKTRVFLAFSLGVCGLTLIALTANPQIISSSPGETEPSHCLTDATIQVTANPTSVVLGQPSTVSWSVQVPTGCAGMQVTFNGQSVARSGSQTVTPPRTSKFNVTVSETHLGAHGQKSQSVEVGVTYPPVVVINPSTQKPVQVLLGALVDSLNDQQTVELCGVDIDLTGITGIYIGNNRSLIGSPGCERTPRRFGPRIFVTDKRGRAPLFVIAGDNVRFSGFRLEGPTDFIAQGDRKEKGIVIAPVAGAEASDYIRNIEISNMEIFHWSGLGVQVLDNVELAERGRLFNTNPGAVRVKGNFFHHNRHGAGEGYGVESAGGAYATIEQNVFDENRHAIAGGSRNCGALDYSGYTVRDNLILAGGGLHCSESWYWALTGWRFNCWQTHQIDMHGDGNSGPNAGCGSDVCHPEDHWYSFNCHNWLCGTAGETMMIERNTILYTKGLAIKIRGNPADKAVVDGNVFKHDSRGDAIDQTGNCGGWGDNITKPIDVRPNNAFDVDPMKELGSGDFFGDGEQEQFMATGVTWWAKSPVTGHWRYLNTMTERLPQLLLTDVDGDGICDVALRPPRPEMAPRTYSKSGTGPWQSWEIDPVLTFVQSTR